LHLNSLGNPNFPFNLNYQDGFNEIANRDYYKMFLYHLPHHGVTRRAIDPSSQLLTKAHSGLNSLLRATCISLFNTDIIHAEMRLTLLQCIRLQLDFHKS
jgi:hypothetical protein